MSSITVSTTGSLGDVLPFVAVGAELRSRGHEVRFLLPTEFHAMVSGEGFDVAPAGLEISPSTLRGLGVDWSRAAGLPLLRSAMRDLVVPALAEAYEAMSQAVATSDLVITHANQIAAQMVAEKLGCRWAVLSLFPMVFPTTEGLAGAGLPQLPGRLRAPGQRAALAVMIKGSGLVLGDRELNRFRRGLDLPARRGYFLSAALSADRVVVPVPELFVPRPSDWPDNVVLSGFCAGVLPGAEVPIEVTEFLAEGPPPVLVTLGSALSSSTARRLQQIADALDRRGIRSLFLVGRDDLDVLQHRRGVATFAPLGRVLASCRAIVHHGGYGTTAAALAAGAPSIVTPFMPDQQWYGRRIEAIGAGVVVTPRRLQHHLGSAVDAALQPQSALRAGAHAAMQRLEGLDGVASTCDEFEQLLDTPPRP